jgi:hypothetical protein
VSGAGECTRIRPEPGVNVLGTIALADRAIVDRHLAYSSRCRDEIAGLAGLPALLCKVPIATAMQLSAERPGGDGPSLQGGHLDRLLSRVAAVRRRRPWRGASPAGRTALTPAGGDGKHTPVS